MTNEEIIAMCDKGEALEYDYGATVTHIDNIPELLNLARQDEREKMQGVEVYISWDEGSFESPTVTIKQPQTNKDSAGRIYHTDLGQNFTIKKEDAEKLNISPGQCKKVRIVEATP